MQTSFYIQFSAMIRPAPRMRAREVWRHLELTSHPTKEAAKERLAQLRTQFPALNLRILTVLDHGSYEQDRRDRQASAS